MNFPTFRKFFRGLRNITPDILIIGGVFLFAYNYFESTSKGFFMTYTTKDWGLIWGVVIFAVGVDILIRRHWKK